MSVLDIVSRCDTVKVMKALLFYRPNSEHATNVEQYISDFARRTGKTLPTVNVDTPEGISECQLYDIVKYPTIIAVDNNGQELQRWDGDMLPQIGEVSYYLQD